MARLRTRPLRHAGGKRSALFPPLHLSGWIGLLLAAMTLCCSPTTAQTPPPVGDWHFIVENGRPVAMAKRTKPDGDHLAGIRIECGPGGKLEYVPVALRSAINTLWVNGADDISHTIPLVRGRVTGPDNVMLSKEFLKFEGFAKRDRQSTWTIEMSVDGAEQHMQSIVMGGFGQVREFMLRSCKP